MIPNCIDLLGKFYNQDFDSLNEILDSEMEFLPIFWRSGMYCPKFELLLTNEKTGQLFVINEKLSQDEIVEQLRCSFEYVRKLYL